MKYGNYDFAPAGKFDKKKFKTLGNLNFEPHTELKLWDEYAAKCFNEKPSFVYNYKDFYKAMGDCEDDIFVCESDGKKYVPCEHELMGFKGYR